MVASFSSRPDRNGHSWTSVSRAIHSTAPQGRINQPPQMVMSLVFTKVGAAPSFGFGSDEQRHHFGAFVVDKKQVLHGSSDFAAPKIVVWEIPKVLLGPMASSISSISWDV